MENELETTNRTYQHINDLKSNILPIIYGIMIIMGFLQSEDSSVKLLEELIRLVISNAFFIYAVILPIKVGQYINFSMIIGAMASQIGIILAINYGAVGITGTLVAFVIALPLVLLIGWLVSLIIIKSREKSITSYFIGYLFVSIYQFFGLFVMVRIINIKSPDLIPPIGNGLSQSIDLTASIAGSIDGLLRVPLFVMIALIIFSMLVFKIYKIYSQDYNEEFFKLFIDIMPMILSVLLLLILHLNAVNIEWLLPYRDIQVPFVPVILVTICGIIIYYFERVQYESLIKKLPWLKSNYLKNPRVILLVSFLLTAIGQIIRLQSSGILVTRSSHRNLAMTAFAALVIGGGSYKQATLKKGLIGLVLFQGFMLLSPDIFKFLGIKNISSVLRLIIFNAVILIGFTRDSYTKTANKNNKF